MYILNVIPIQRGIPFNNLSYYHSEALLPGTLLEIPLGKQTIHGLVYECTSLIEAKTHIKQATFSLKRIKKVVGHSDYFRGITQGLHNASLKTLTPVGSLASNVIDEMFFDFFQNVNVEQKDTAIKEPLAVFGPTVDRIDQYKRIIRTAFANKTSVILIAPTIRSVEFWFSVLQKGIVTHSAMLHSKQTKRDQKNSLSIIKNLDRPIFICATPHYGLIPKADITTLILEDESSPLYKTNDRYGADMRVVIESIAKFTNTQIVYGDVLPRFETLHKTNSLNIPRALSPEKLIVVPTEKYRTTLPTETIELLRYCQKNKKSVLLYTNRKGIAPLSRCSDCGTTVDCPTCSLPIVLRHKIVGGERQRLFICTHCGDTLPPEHLCSYCGGWNIIPVSVGTESLYDAAVSVVGEENCILIDDDLTPDAKNVDAIITATQKQKWFVMIGTQKILPYIKDIDFIVIPFFDRLLSIPSPYTVEEALRLIMLFNDKAKESLIICTKNPDFDITKQLATKKIQEIIDNDMEARSSLGYPPFGVLIKLSVTVPPSHQETLEKKVALFFQDKDITMLPVRRIGQDTMKLLCIWIIQGDNSYVEDFGEQIQLFLQELRFPYSIDINPSRLS